MKGKEESDHNTITMEVRINKHQEKRKHKTIWKMNDKKGWTNFNNYLIQKNEKKPINNYAELHKAITETMKETLQKITLKEGQQKKPKLADETKRKLTKVRELRKEVRLEIKNNTLTKTRKIEEYIKAQKLLKIAVEEDIKNNIEKKIKAITSSKNQIDEMWRIAKRMKNNKAEEKEETFDEEGRQITDAEEAKEHIANYFENLYQARDGEPGTEEQTKEIKDNVKKWSHETIHQQSNIDLEELKQAKKKLKKKKACGPDDIPNEAIIEANDETLRLYTRIFNNIYNSEIIPEEWTIGTIKRIYKGKGKKGKCSNERGITLASNMGKTFERIINNRVKAQIKITDNQAGGKEGRATSDHIMTLQSTINKAIQEEKKAYVTFLDVTKAYNKAWLDGIMYVMRNNGLTGKDWKITKNLNENLRAIITTDNGPTREIKIRDSIRQGGVLSVNQYALLMDEINKEIEKNKLGIKYNNQQQVGCLLWMDDVALITTNGKELQSMLNITNQIANKYHIKFGKEKSKTIKMGKVGRNTEDEKFTLGEMEIETTDNYKYLGITINNKRNLQDHIRTIKGKVEAAYQTIMAITEDSNLKGIQMKSAWNLINACILPIITYGLEAIPLKRKEVEELNKIWLNIIKRILMTPQSTPTEAIYMETGLTDIESIIDRNRLLMASRLQRNSNTLTATITQDKTKNGWYDITNNTLTKYELKWEDLVTGKQHAKTLVKSQIHKKFKELTKTQAQQKSKLKNLTEKTEWIPGKIKPYLKYLTRKQASNIFRLRSRMAPIKENYKNKYPDQTCRLCKNQIETQRHILNECQVIHTDNKNKINENDIFKNSVQVLKNINQKWENIMEYINEV